MEPVESATAACCATTARSPTPWSAGPRSNAPYTRYAGIATGDGSIRGAPIAQGDSPRVFETGAATSRSVQAG